ncbi:DhaKLM operon coactivator DhaQ [Vagococcus bubulae]|uniref:DhaKLM operon coactivator DhaQ n=1 Tax=Vagococcus bubulae TaxID=1977868 RepID=A0A429ZME8_9ENTE|nr:DhaKLM operon coactivator DhaQ [Vagococcus bubulae]RST94875.1 DhaKLM operon coactivator DhaQ [Vagococcus bubulae]
MTRIINKPKDTVSQVLNGVAYIHQDILQRVPKTGILLRKDKTSNKVSIISGGGSGHEPAHFGYIGENMLDASVSGPLFIPPTAEEVFEAIKKTDQGLGVLLIIKNFEADVTNFLKAKEMAVKAGHKVGHVIVNDDCSVETGSFEKRRRGVAGTVFVHKILGAAASEGKSIAELVKLGETVVQSMNSLGVALSSGTSLTGDKINFDLEKDMISFGIGIHGEKGYRSEPFYSSEHLANELINKLLVQYEDYTDKKFAILINGLGTTTIMEQYVFSNDVRRLLDLEDVEIVFAKTGNYMTSTDMAGISLTFLEIVEEKWLDYLKMTTNAFAWS